MTPFQKASLFLLRVSLGWLFFYTGIIKILNPDWSAGPYIQGAKTFTHFYQWFLDPAILPWVTRLNEWGLTLIGVALILGFFVRPASIAGIALMLLYYFPILVFPHVGDTGLLVDEHSIYSCAFLILAVFRAGRVWGIDARL